MPLDYDNSGASEMGNWSVGCIWDFQGERVGPCHAEQNHSDWKSSSDMNFPLYLYIYVTLFNIVIFVVGIIGNLMVILVITRMHAMHTRMNYFLLSLSIADLLVLTVCQPTALLVFYAKERWLIGEAMCKMLAFLEHATLHSSVLTLLVIGMERYCIIKRSRRGGCRSLFTSIWILIAAIWGLACLLSLPFAFHTILEEVPYYDDTYVKQCRTLTAPVKVRAYLVALFVVFFVVPLLLLSFMYSSIVRKLFTFGRHQSQAPVVCSVSVRSSPRSLRFSRSSRTPHMATVVRVSTASSTRRPLGNRFADRVILVRQRVVIMMMVIVVLFFVTMLPFQIFALWITFSSSASIADMGFEPYYNVLSTSRLLTYVNSAGNPIIYKLLSPTFRRAFRKLFKSDCLRN